MCFQESLEKISEFFFAFLCMHVCPKTFSNFEDLLPNYAFPSGQCYSIALVLVSLKGYGHMRSETFEKDLFFGESPNNW